MCGIAGIISKNKDDKEGVLKDMVKCIVHRGPDDEGFYVDTDVALGMRRLAIIDLATGHQPIFSNDSNLVIVFNGEIYNYQELRDKYLSHYKFNSHSDTEVILALYEERGAEMLKLLRGMFTLAIHDKQNQKVFIARDLFGIKPLYYLKQAGKVVAFSSEIKSFLKYPGFEVEVNDKAAYNYLTYQYNPFEETFFKNVFKLPPASSLLYDLKTDSYKIEKYWEFKLNPKEDLDEEQTKKQILKTMEDSVRHHMVSDVPVGSFLSGGIDSSINAVLMQKVRGDKKIKTFTVGFESVSEAPEAKETSSFLGTDHTEITVNADTYFEALPKAAWHFDEPVADPSAIGLYFLAKEARKHVTVVLSGEGADELFGGYNIYLEPFARKKIAWIPHFILNLFISLPFEFIGKNYLRRATTKLEDRYIGNASIFGTEELKELWRGSTQEKFPIDKIYKNISNLSDSDKMQMIDVQTWLVGDILAKADKMTMAHSLELRVPFLDKEVAKLAITLPDKFKWRGGETKYLLRKAFSDVIPETTRKRKKLGFPTPLRTWLTPDRQDVYDTILESPYIKKNMNVEHIKKLISDHTSHKRDNSRKIYVLLMLSLWYAVFVDQKAV